MTTKQKTDNASGVAFEPLVRPCEQELHDWCEMLVRWMKRKMTDRQIYYDGRPALNLTVFDIFREEYPAVASEMDDWIKALTKARKSSDA